MKNTNILLEQYYSILDKIDKSKFDIGEWHTIQRGILHQVFEECMLDMQLFDSIDDYRIIIKKMIE